MGNCFRNFQAAENCTVAAVSAQQPVEYVKNISPKIGIQGDGGLCTFFIQDDLEIDSFVFVDFGPLFLHFLRRLRWEQRREQKERGRRPGGVRAVLQRGPRAVNLA